MFDDKPSVLFGKCSVSASTMAGASFGLVGTLDKLPDVYVSSSAGSVATDLMVSTVAVPTAAFNLAEISSVFDV